MGRPGDDYHLFGGAHLLQSRPVEFNNLVVISADNQQRGRPYTGRLPFGQVWPTTAGDDGSYVLRPLSGGCVASRVALGSDANGEYVDSGRGERLGSGDPAARPLMPTFALQATS